MGEIRASVTLENGGDRAVVDRGHGVEADADERPSKASSTPAW